MLAPSLCQLSLFGEEGLSEEVPVSALDEDEAFLRIVQRIVPASAERAPEAAHTAPRSVFDLVARPVSVILKGDDTEELRVVARVQLGEGHLRVHGAAFPSRWTEEDHERERLRRARQRPPRPTKKARTRGKKLLELIGAEDEA